MLAKYTNFREADVVMKPSKKAPWDPLPFVGITCPHCDVLFVEIPQANLKTNKASQCLKHLRKCRPDDVKDPPEKKRKYTNEDLMKAVEEVRAESAAERVELKAKIEEVKLESRAQYKKQKKELYAAEKRICKTISQKVSLGPPDAETRQSLYERLDQAAIPSVMSNCKNLGAKDTCAVCLDESKPANTIFKPCMHSVVCWECCWPRMKEVAGSSNPPSLPKCPVCCTPIKAALCWVPELSEQFTGM